MVKDQNGPSFLRFGGKKSENNAGARYRTGLSLSCSHATSKLPGVSPGRQEPVEDVRAVLPASATNDSGSDRHSPSITHCRHSSAGSSITDVLATSRAEVMQTGSMSACSAPATSSSASVSPSPTPRPANPGHLSPALSSLAITPASPCSTARKVLATRPSFSPKTLSPSFLMAAVAKGRGQGSGESETGESAESLRPDAPQVKPPVRQEEVEARGKAPASVGKEKVLRAMDVVGRHDLGQAGTEGLLSGGTEEKGVERASSARREKDFIEKGGRETGREAKEQDTGPCEVAVVAPSAPARGPGRAPPPSGLGDVKSPSRVGTGEALEAGGEQSCERPRYAKGGCEDAEAGHAPASEAQEAGQALEALEEECRSLSVRLQAAHKGAQILGEEAARANEELGRRTELLQNLETHANEREAELQELRAALRRAEAAREDAEQQQGVWEERCRRTEGVLGLVLEREKRLMREKLEQREEVTEIRRRAYEYERMVRERGMGREEGEGRGSGGEGTGGPPSKPTSRPRMRQAPPMPGASSNPTGRDVLSPFPLRPFQGARPAAKTEADMSGRGPGGDEGGRGLGSASRRMFMVIPDGLKGVLGAKGRRGGGSDGGEEGRRGEETESNRGGRKDERELETEDSDRRTEGRTEMEGEEEGAGVREGYRAQTAASGAPNGVGRVLENRQGAGRQVMRGREFEAGHTCRGRGVAACNEDDLEQAARDRGEGVMTLYAHPEFEAEFGELVGTVIADAVSHDPPGAETSRGTKGGHEAASPTPPCLLPASPSKAGPGTLLLYVAFVCTGRLDDPIHTHALKPFLAAGASVVLFLLRAGRGNQVARIQPRQELTGLPCFEFLVFKRALQRTEDGYAKEVRLLRSFLVKSLPSLRVQSAGLGAATEGVTTEGVRPGKYGAPADEQKGLPSLTDYLFRPRTDNNYSHLHEDADIKDFVP